MLLSAGKPFTNNDSKCGKCVKAVLHLDEMTPHIHVHKVPIDPKGKLNCKHYFGSKAQGAKFQDEMYEIYKHLDLKRGIPKSRAADRTRAGESHYGFTRPRKAI